jgi:hypothetical protein
MSEMQPNTLTTRAGSPRRVVLALAQVGVALLGLVVVAAAGLLMLLAQLSHNREEATLWTAGAAVGGVAALAGLVWLFVYLNRRRKAVGSVSANLPDAIEERTIADPNLATQSSLQLLRIALIAILVLGLGGLVLRFMGGRPPARILVISLVMAGAYIAPYVFALLRISERFDSLGVTLAHAFAWISVVMSFRMFAMFVRYTAEYRQVLVLSALNLLLDALVIYCGIRLWRATRAEVFVALLVGALIYRAVLDMLAPMVYSRIAF